MSSKKRGGSGSERGATLVFVGLGLIALLGVMALAIDLGLLYIARGEAQRAADSAALAGAKGFLYAGCPTAGCTSGGYQETVATQQADAVGGSNQVLGKPVTVSNISFTYPTPYEPQITLNVASNVSTVFARIFGVSTVNVSAVASAEAYSPNGGSAPVSIGCVVPFIVPNCDSSPVDVKAAGTQNPACGAGSTYFVNPLGSSSPPTPVAEQAVTPNGPIGTSYALHFGNGPSASGGPSQWYLAAFGNSQSKAALRSNIENCSADVPQCGAQFPSMNGKAVGPVDQGVGKLIHATGAGMNMGQDSIAVSSVGTLPVFTITGGSNNPNLSLRGASWLGGPSDSIVAAPIYDAVNGNDALPPGGTMVQVEGYMQLFITDYEKTNGFDTPVNAIIMGIWGCGARSATPPPAIVAGGTFVPIRLIQHPN